MTRPPLSPDVVAELVETAMRWELVETLTLADSSVELRAAGRPFAVVGPEGAWLTLPPRVGAMLVETGRAEAPDADGRVLVRPAPGDGIDPDLLLLAYERARVSARVTGR